MQSRSCKSYAKINLTLASLEKRPDGYHEVETVMHSVSLCDTVTLMRTSSCGIFLRTNLPYVPTDERNIAYKAAALFYKTSNLSAHVQIDLHKRIPVGAGMAGGSTNAAAVLRLLNSAHGEMFSLDELAKMSLVLGADVPYCVYSEPAFACGIGEILSPVTKLPPCFFLICKPKFSISTQKLFQKMDTITTQVHADSTSMQAALARGDLNEICSFLGNDMEKAAIMERPKIAAIKRKLLSSGALGAQMTGSGSAVYGIFATELAAQAAKSAFERDVWTYLARPVANAFGEVII